MLSLMTNEPQKPTVPEAPAAPQEPAALDATEKNKKVKGPTPLVRLLVTIFTVVVSAVIAAVLIGPLPVLTLNEFFEKTDLGSIDPEKEGLRIVLTSTSLWFVAIGGLLALISFFAAALDVESKWRNFWWNQIPAVASATFIFIGGLFLVLKP